MLKTIIKVVVIIGIIWYLTFLLWPIAIENYFTLRSEYYLYSNDVAKASNIYKNLVNRQGVEGNNALYGYADLMLNTLHQRPELGYDKDFIKDMNEVIYFLEQDIKRHPKSLFSWSYLAQFYEAAGDEKKYTQAVSKMFELSPERYSM